MKNLGSNCLDEQWFFELETGGAANMIEEKIKLAAKIKRIVTDIVSQYWIAHRLNFSVLNSLISLKYLDNLDTVFKTLYKFYRNSP